MIDIDLAIRLRGAGLVWRPRPGEHFAVPGSGLDDETFVISDMTIQVYDLPKGQVIGFNGTTEWALDDVARDEAVWLPREDQLRELLGGAFRALERAGGGYRVVVEVGGARREFAAATPERGYGEALLHLIALATAP